MTYSLYVPITFQIPSFHWLPKTANHLISFIFDRVGENPTYSAMIPNLYTEYVTSYAFQAAALDKGEHRPNAGDHGNRNTEQHQAVNAKGLFVDRKVTERGRHIKNWRAKYQKEALTQYQTNAPLF